MKSWPKTTPPPAVAGPVAARDEHLWRSSGIAISSAADRKLRPESAFGVTLRAPLSCPRSTAELRVTMSSRSIGAAVVGGAAARRAVGDAAHLGELLLVEPPQQQGVGQQPQARPAGRRLLAVLLDRELPEVGDDLVGEQEAVLEAARVRLALDVQHDPAAVLVAVPLAPPAHRLGRDQLVRRRSPPRRPGRRTRRCRAAAPLRPSVELHAVLGRGWR